MKNLKRIFIALMLIMVTLLTSCTSDRINQLKKVEFETEDSYALFTHNYLCNKSKTIKYNKIFNADYINDIKVNYISNYAYISCKADGSFCLAKYDLNNNKYTVNKFKIGEQLYWHSHFFDGEYYFVSFYDDNDNAFYAYSFDLDFNMEKFVINSSNDTLAVDTLYSDYGVAFIVKTYNGRDYTIKNIKVIKNNEMSTINFNNEKEYNYNNDLVGKYFIEYRYLWEDNIVSGANITYMYDLEEKKVIYSDDKESQIDYDTYNEINNYYNEYVTKDSNPETIKEEELEEKSEAYNKIKKLYKTSEDWTPNVREYDSVKYIQIYIYHRKEINNIWGDHYFKDVDKIYTLYAYDDVNNTIKYIGFSEESPIYIIKK